MQGGGGIIHTDRPLAKEMNEYLNINDTTTSVDHVLADFICMRDYLVLVLIDFDLHCKGIRIEELD